MLKFELLQVQDVKEAAAIERRRRYEEERKKRIFNARNRLIGNDYDELKKQIEEQRQRKVEEKQLEERYNEQQRRDAEYALTLERKELDERRKIQQEINTFRQMYQRAEDRREFDLNDPQAIKKSLPARLNDDDPRCGLSSAQKFEGEDLKSAARKKIQVEQTRACLQQQIQEQRAAEKELKEAEAAYQAAVVSRDLRASELNQLEIHCRLKLEQAMASYNKALLEQQESTKEIKHRQELEDNFAEMYNAVTSDMLTENPNASQSNFGPSRPVAYMYRGMTPEERIAVRKDQLKQIDETKQKREEEERLKQYWDEYALKSDMTSSKIEYSLKLKERELAKKLADYNITLAKEQKAHNDYMERIIYTNKPTASYFQQFNTSTR